MKPLWRFTRMGSIWALQRRVCFLWRTVDTYLSETEAAKAASERRLAWRH